MYISADGKLTGTMTVDGHSEYGEAAIIGMVDNAGKYVFTYKFPIVPDTFYRSKGTYTITGNTITGSYTTEEIGKDLREFQCNSGFMSEPLISLEEESKV